jgi:hypothetical protein
MPLAAGNRRHSRRRTGEEIVHEQTTVGRWLELIQAEYREMPGLNLSKAQMQRLWGFDAAICDALVDALVAARVLRRTSVGSYTTQPGV